MTDQPVFGGNSNPALAPPQSRNTLASLPDTSLPVLGGASALNAMPLSALPTPLAVARFDPDVSPLAKPDAARVAAAKSAAAGTASAEPDVLDFAGRLRPLAELALHRKTATPLTIGLIGAAGAGKSFALDRLAGSITELADDSARRDGNSPFVAKVGTIAIDATSLHGALDVALAQAIHGGLVEGGDFAAAGHEAAQSAGNPHDIARMASDRVDMARQDLDSQRQRQDDVNGRISRLKETVLKEAAGTPIDDYVRQNRALIETRLRMFGFTSGDAAGHFRDLVGELSERTGANPALSSFFRAVWAFRGQTRLLIFAVLFAALGFGLRAVDAAKVDWLDRLQQAGPDFAGLNAWLAAHESWLPALGVCAFGLAGLMLALNSLRALRFTRPLLKGVRLLREDVAARRVELDALCARQTRRVQKQTAEVARLEQVALLAEQRAAASDMKLDADEVAGRAALGSLSALGADSTTRAARAYIPALVQLMAQSPASKDALPQSAIPERIILTFDDLEALPAPRAIEIMSAVYRLLANTPVVAIFTCDPNQIGSVELERTIDVPFQIASSAMDSNQTSALVLSALGHTSAVRRSTSEPFNASTSALDQPLSVTEARWLSEIAPLSGTTPRAVRRFASLFRLVRASAEPADVPAAAFMLALGLGGDHASIASFNTALDQVLAAGDAAQLPSHANHPKLQRGLDAARGASGGVLTAQMLRDGSKIAQRYQFSNIR